MGEIFCCILHFRAIPQALWWWGKRSLCTCICICSSAEGQEQPCPRLHLCAEMKWGIRGRVVCYHQLMSQQTISKPLCIFLSILMHTNISLAEANQLTQTYAKSRKGRLIDQEDRNELLYLTGYFFFYASGTRFIVMITNHKGHLSPFSNLYI